MFRVLGLCLVKEEGLRLMGKSLFKSLLGKECLGSWVFAWLRKKV